MDDDYGGNASFPVVMGSCRISRRSRATQEPSAVCQNGYTLCA